MIEQQAHRLSEAIGAILTKMLHDLIEQARFVSVGVGHFGIVLFAKTSKPIWPAPATPDPIFRPFYAAAFATLQPPLRKSENRNYRTSGTPAARVGDSSREGQDSSREGQDSS